jgi:hypothetical protein
MHPQQNLAELERRRLRTIELLQRDISVHVVAALQGLGSYFVGSLMNFETVEHTARYSLDFVDPCFT